MKSKLIVAILFLFAQYNVLGQSAASFNYEIQTGNLGTTYSWIDCSSGTTILSTGDDVQTIVSWPFSFRFYDNNYTTSNYLSVASNGFIRLDGIANGSNYNAASNYNLTADATSFGQIIALAVHDGNVSDNGSWIRSLVTGTTPNRIFTIEYNNLEIDYNDNKYADVQVSLYESSNKIVLKLGSENINKSGADMGLHSGVSGYFNKWKEVNSGTNNTWIEYSTPFVEVNATIGTSTDYYSSLKDAFDKINDGTHKGNVTVKLKSSTNEIASAVLNASGSGSSNYSSVYIYPTTTGLSINGNLATPLIDLNGADNVTIDGRVNATGTTNDLSIINTSTSSTAGTSTIRFINGATNNTIKYSTIKGSETSDIGGVLFFSTTTAGSGNISNTIDNNNITCSTNAGRPINAIYSAGTVGKENSGIVISNNAIYDFLKHGNASNGIFLSSNTTSCTIGGNSFYETTSFAPTAVATYYAIYINNTTGNDFTVSNNFIGGSAALCGGSSWTKTSASNNVFNAISLNAGTTIASSVQNNTIKNFSWNNSSNAVWKGIEILGGNVNIGTATGNTIGSSSGTGSVTVTGATTGQDVNAIEISSTGTVDCQNNTIGSITVGNGSTLSGNFYGIYKTATTGTTTISNNFIGSTATANSVNAGSASTANAQVVYGIYNAGTGTIVISNNTISKLNNATSNSVVGTLGVINGLASLNGTNTISNNTIYDLTISNANTNAANSASVCGIAITGTTNPKTISGNTIYNLANNYVAFAGNVFGIYFEGSTLGSNVVSENMIHGLSVTGANSTSANLTGIKIAAGTTTYSNNIVNLGGNTQTTVYGIYETGAANNNNSIYFNTVYINGSLSSGSTNKSYAIFSDVTSNVRNFRNNIFMNERSTTAGANLHYAAYFNYDVDNALTVDFNNYFVTGTGGVLGFYGSNKASLPIITGQDANSLDVNPNFVAAGGSDFTDYYSASTLEGIFGTGILTDYEGITRSTTPKMGAIESSLAFIWEGDLSTDFANAGNWYYGAVPPNGAEILFATTPANDCYLDQNRTLKNITNTSTKKLIINGNQLTLTGNIISATASQIDASGASSEVVFAGTAAQNIPAGIFVSNTFGGLTVNNSAGLTQNGAVTILTELTLANGAFNIGPNTLQINGLISTTGGTLNGGSTSNLIIEGSGTGTTLPAVTVNNFTLNRLNGINLGGDLTIEGTLTLTSGTLIINSNTLKIKNSNPVRINGNIDAGHSYATLNFSNPVGMTLPASLFSGAINNLTINGGGITAIENITVNGILNLQTSNPSSTKGLLDMTLPNELIMGADATNLGGGDVTGIITRNTILENRTYTFGNKNTWATYYAGATALPSYMKVKVVIGADVWGAGTVQRVYELIQENGSNSFATFRAFYLDSELNGNAEDELSFLSAPFPFDTPEDNARSNSNVTENWLELADVDLGYFPSAFGQFQICMDESDLSYLTWTGRESDEWNNPANWAEAPFPGTVPTPASFVVIPDAATTANDPTLPPGANTEIKTISLKSGSILNSGTTDNAQLSLNHDIGTWNNTGGTFNPGNSTVNFIYPGNSTISGTTTFNNFYISESTFLTMTANSYIKVAGGITINEVGADSGELRTKVSGKTTVEYNGANQTIINPLVLNGFNGYYKLVLSGSGIKTMPTTALNISDEFVLKGPVAATAQATLTVGDELEVLNGATFATGAFDHFVGGHFDIGGHLGDAGTFIPSTGTTITLNGTEVQKIYGGGPISFENLEINNNAGVDIFENISVNGFLTLTNGNLNVGTTTLTINGDLAKTAGFILANTTSSLTFGGTTALTIPASVFYTTPSINNLTVTRTGGVVAGSDFTVNGILNLQSSNPSATIGTFSTGNFILDMGANATTTGIGDVTGKIRRSVILPNTEYSFGHQFSTVTFPNIGTLPTEITLKVSIGTAPTWKTDGVKRIYDISQIGGSGTNAVLKSHYLDSELNGLAEEDLGYFSYIFPSTTLLERGHTEINTTDNWITLSNANFGNLSSAFGVIEHGFAVSVSDVITWDGSTSTDWYDASNWLPAYAPSSEKHVIIPDAASTPNDPLIAASTVSFVLSLDIRAGGILNAGAGSQLTIMGTAGAWENTGTFNPGTGTVIFNHGTASEIVTISGSTTFYNIEVGPNTTLQPVPGNMLSIAAEGIADVTSIVDFSTVNNTVEWNGADQTIVNPTGLAGNSGYYHLILSGSGTKTMPASQMNISGNFSTLGTANVVAEDVFMISGNTTIGNGSTFETGNFNHLLAGNFENNGTFTVTAGSTITFNGNSAQTISGTSAISFYNLTIDNLFNVTQAANVDVNNLLLLNNGNLIVGNSTLSLNGTISNPSGAIVVSSGSNLSFGGTSALTINNNLFNANPSFNNLIINRSGGVTLGNQSLSIAGTLELTSGTLSLLANKLTLSGNSPVRVSGNIDASNSNSEMIFSNASAITLPADFFSGSVANFKISGTGGVISSGNLGITGILNLEGANPSPAKGSLDMAISSELTMEAAATTIGIGDVTGIVKREHVFNDGVDYTFGNQFTSLNFLNVSVGIKPTWVKCKISIGTAPTWRSEAINRVYSFAQSGGTDRMIVKLHYLDSELHGTETDETQLVYWDAYDPALAPNNFVSIYPRSYGDRNSNANYIQLTGPAINYIATSNVLDVKQWGLSYSTLNHIHIWTGNGSPSYDGDWSLPGNWSGGVPEQGCQVLIPNPADLPVDNNGDLFPYRNLLPDLSPARARTLEIDAGATLNITADYDITIYGDTSAWVNNGTFIPGTANVIFANGVPSNVVSISGITDFYELTVTDKTNIQPAAGSIIRIKDALNYESGSILDFTTNNCTIEYNGAAQTVVNPNVGTTGYYNLTLSGNGVKTLPASSFQITGNLSLTESANATATSDLTIGANLNLSNTSKLTMAAAKSLTVAGAISNAVGNSGFVLQSDASGTASLIHNSDNVPATVERYISGNAEDWHFLSSPVSNQSIGGDWLQSGTYGNGTGYDLYVWDEPTPCWVYHLNTTVAPNWPAVHPSANFVPGRGYLYAVQQLNPTKAFTGNLNNGTVSYALTIEGAADVALQGFNLVGNPYPSSIDWKAASGWTRGNLITSGTGYDMWIWNPAAGNYGVYNSDEVSDTGTNAVTRFIPPMQGFFVRAENAGNLQVTNDVRVHDATILWKSGQIEPSRFIAVVHSETDHTFDEVRLLFGYPEDNAGAAKLFSPLTTAPSLCLPLGEADFTIRYLSDTITNPSVPLRFKAGRDGNYTINFDFNKFDFGIVILEDKLTGEYTDLTVEPELRFSSSIKDNENRFIIHFGAIPVKTNIELPANIYSGNGELVIDLTLVDEPTDVQVVDVLGRTILQKNLNGNCIHKLNVQAKSQIVIVYAKTSKAVVSRKIFIN